ncbi:GTPase family protein [Brachymonas sp.]|uniref:GTPase family protein n=1 Tax=Brachymonas sp. TaxID=1936292 RepID=UPI0035B24547
MSDKSIEERISMLAGMGLPSSILRGLPNGAQEKMEDFIKEKISQIRNYTPKVGVFGNSGVGKSSLCNALFGKEVAKISDVEACTRGPQEILIGKNNGEGGIILIDVPGIGEDPEHHQEYTKLYISLASELDLILWLIKADDRNYASSLEAYKNVKKANPEIPVIFVITQVAKTNPFREWNFQKNEPGIDQKKNIVVKEHDISKRFEISTKFIISISSEEKFNLKKLVDLVVEVLPNETKYSFTRETKEENVSEEARANAEKGAWENTWESVKEWLGEMYDKFKEPLKELAVGIIEKTIQNILGKYKS